MELQWDNMFSPSGDRRTDKLALPHPPDSLSVRQLFLQMVFKICILLATPYKISNPGFPGQSFTVGGSNLFGFGTG